MNEPDAPPAAIPAPADAGGYRVLARRYRPQRLADLVGQEATVRALRAAFETGRIAQAFILTGIRGTGKTTTARLIAKGLNCVGPDGTGGPTTDPCGVCEPCVAITEGRHVDVLEMDAASRTGVNDVREIIDSVAYRAASARYKVHIIDEVHMLSTSAFNALLKTLEEPPPHVVFVFATTEIRKVPATVLSRCQRFDLRRIAPDAMIALLGRIAKAEGVSASDDALALIARAAEGSARDATSILDQSIAVAGGAAIEAGTVRAMLGLADRGRVLDLFETILRGDAAAALGELRAQHEDGADALAVLRDLAEAAHWVSVVKIAPGAADDPLVSPDARTRGVALAERAPMRALSRMWQMLLLAIEEAGRAPSALMAAEMAVIRLTHVADLPSPEELVRRLQDAAPEDTVARPGAAAAAGAAPSVAAQPAEPVAMRSGGGGGGGGGESERRPAMGLKGSGALAVARAPEPDRQPDRASGPEPAPAGPLARYARFEDVLALIREKRDLPLLFEVEGGLRLVRYAPGRIEFTPAEGAAPDLAQRLSTGLARWTGARWGVSVVSGGEAPTLAEAREGERAALEAEARAHPLVQAVLARFPGARITEIRPPQEVAPPSDPEPETDGSWDPFEDG